MESTGVFGEKIKIVDELKSGHELQEKLNKHHGSKLDAQQHLDRIDRVIRGKTSKKITKLKRNKTEYLLDNSKYVFEYFENKKEYIRRQPR